MSLGHPLLRICRGDIAEVSLHGVYGLVTTKNQILSNQPQDLLIWARSLLKPFQYLALAESGKLELEIPEELVAIASSSGEATHEYALDTLAKHWRIEIEDHLYCKPSLPMAERLAWQKRLNDDPTLRRFHPCAGKHLNFYRHSGTGYQSVNSLAHQAIYKLLNDWGITQSTSVKPDSCGVQTFALTLENHLHLWQQLLFKQTQPLVHSLLNHWSQNPSLVGGSDRLDSQISIWTNGRILAKEGADGLLILAHRDSKEVLFLKSFAGYQSLHLRLLLSALLHKFGDTLASEFAKIKHQLILENLVSADQNLQFLI